MIPPLLFDAILFDLDGTLVATDRFWLQAARTGTRSAFQELGLERELPRPEAWMGIVGLTADQGFAQLFPDLPHEQQQLILAACDAEQERLLEGGHGALMPGAERLLGQLRDAGLQLGIASNCGQYYLDQMQGSLGLKRYFQAAYCADTPGISDKGDMLERLLLGFGTRSAIMVGDRKGDRLAAWSNGLPAVHCAFGFSDAGEGQGAEASIADLGALWGVLERRALWIEAVLAQAGAWPEVGQEDAFVLGITGGVAAGKTLFARDVVRLLEAQGCTARLVSLEDFQLSRRPPSGPEGFDLERLDLEVLGPHREAGGYLVLEGSFLLDPRLQSRLDRTLYLEADEEIMWRRLSGNQGRLGGVDALSELRSGSIPAVEAHRSRYDPNVLADLLVDASNPLGPNLPAKGPEGS